MDQFILPLKRYAQFSGRSRRREYWLYVLFVVVVSVIATLLDRALGLGGSYTGNAGNIPDGSYGFSFNMQGGILTAIWGLLNFIPGLAVGIRRLHDTDRSGWWFLILLIPLAGAIIWLVFMCTEGTRGPNRFGPDPKQAGPY